MKTFRFLGFALVAILLCLSACSKGDDDPISPTPKPEVNNPTITLDSSIQASGLSFDTSASEKSISFTTTSDWTLSIAETRGGTEWCKASPTSGGKGTANVKFTTTENTESDDRSVAVTIKAGATSKTFTVSQKGKDALLVTSKKYELPKEGGEIEIEVKANVDYQMTIAESAKEWITEATGRALTTHKHILKIAPSEEAVKREGEITFKSGDMVETVKVYQAGEAVLLLSKNEFTVSDAGETISVDLQSNVEYGVQMPNVDWIQAEEASRAMSSHTLKYIVKANESSEARSAEIVFYDKNSDLKNTLKVIQNKKEQEDIEDIPYLAFKADALQTLTMTKAVETLEYSVNGGEWKELGINTISFGGNLGNLQLRGKSYFGTARNTFDYSQFIFGNDVEVSCTGDIRTLINHEFYDVCSSKYAKFYNLFSDCQNLISAPELPATTLAAGCYSGMFSGCTALKNAPELPATILAEGCYSGMFEGCTSLTEAPKLPATTLAEGCYGGMFEGCTSLVISPELPAITLATQCYRDMFNGCIALEEAPELPATTLAEYCYWDMFEGCIALAETPRLLATTLAKGCYCAMFDGCIALAEAPELPATILAEACYSSMFKGCSSLTKAPELPATTLAVACYSSMLEGCTSLVLSPELPATTLASSCYSFMFGGCTALTETPVLPATTLAEHCYFGMFSGCNSLTSASELPAMTLAKFCYTEMFNNCTNLQKAPTELPATLVADYCYAEMFNECINLKTIPAKLPATTIAKGCYSAMFRKCKSIVTAPELPATTIAETCYNRMFEGCIGLIEGPVSLPATTLAKNCYNYMFYDCIGLTTAPKLPASTLVESCYKSMFYSCYKINSITMLATDISAENCLSSWLSNVSATGTFTKSASMTSLPSGYSGIPEGWEVKDYTGE